MSSIASQLSFSRARNIVGGATGSFPYQDANSSTVFVPIGSNGFVLTSNGTTATWTAASSVTAGSANNILVTATTTASSYFLTFVDSNNATATYEPLFTDAGIVYNPSSDLLALTGSITINGGSLQTSQTTFNLVNTTATTVNLAGAATSLIVGATTGVTEIRNATTVSNTTLSSSTLTGALKVLGGIGANNLFVSNAKIISPNTDGNTVATIPLDVQGAWIRIGDGTTGFAQSGGGIGIKLHDSGNTHWSLAMTNTNFVIAITSTNGDQLLPASRTDALLIDGSGNITGAANITATGDVAVNGGDLTTNQATFNLIDATATTVNFARASTSLTIGANAAGTVTIRNNTNATTTGTGGLVVYGGVGIGGNLYVGGTINGTISNAGNATNILTTATTTASNYFLTFVDSNNAVAAYESVYTDAGLTYNPSSDLLTLSGNITINGGSLQTNQATFALLGTTVTTASVLSSGTAITIGELTGFTAVRNQFTVTNATSAISTLTGALQVRGGAGVGGSLYVGNRVGFVNTSNVSAVYQVYNAALNSLDTVFG
jgi:hypothetical protein